MKSTSLIKIQNNHIKILYNYEWVCLLMEESREW